MMEVIPSKWGQNKFVLTLLGIRYLYIDFCHVAIIESEALKSQCVICEDVLSGQKLTGSYI